MPSSRFPTSVRRLLVAASVLALLCLFGAPAHAVPGSIGATPRIDDNTDIVMTGTGPGRAVTGAIGPVDSRPDLSQDYPTLIPADFTRLDEGFAGIITAESRNLPPGTPPETLYMYCIDIRTITQPGFGYENGTWVDSNVPNVDYIARILQEYYPKTGEPTPPIDVNQRAAAVQSAIWYFSDNYILQPDDPTRPYTAAIVNAVVEDGPLPEPSRPNLTIAPTDDSGPAGDPLGPFTVTSDAEVEITVFAQDGTMYSDPAGTTQIPDGASVPSGTQIWLRADGDLPGTVTLNARGVASVPSGNVYLYDGNTPEVDDAQRLILAQDAEISTLSRATADFFQASSLRVTKTIAGSAAGDQGAVRLHVSCGNGLERDIDVLANAPAGDTTPTTIENLPVGTVCTVTEPTNGSSAGVSVTTTYVGNPATIVAGEIAGVTVTNRYETVLSSLG